VLAECRGKTGASVHNPCIIKPQGSLLSHAYTQKYGRNSEDNRGQRTTLVRALSHADTYISLTLPSSTKDARLANALTRTYTHVCTAVYAVFRACRHRHERSPPCSQYSGPPQEAPVAYVWCVLHESEAHPCQWEHVHTRTHSHTSQRSDRYTT
jgi:hypothetical protein